MFIWIFATSFCWLKICCFKCWEQWAAFGKCSLSLYFCILQAGQWYTKAFSNYSVASCHRPGDVTVTTFQFQFWVISKLKRIFKAKLKQWFHMDGSVAPSLINQIEWDDESGEVMIGTIPHIKVRWNWWRGCQTRRMMLKSTLTWRWHQTWQQRANSVYTDVLCICI